jgi:hypothetical protein
MTTALDIIQDAYENLGVYAPGEVVSSADATRGLQVLNDMIDLWQSENIPVYALSTVTATMSNGVGAYTIGLGGTINVARPVAVQLGPGVATLTHSAVVTPVNVIGPTEWEQFESKATGTGSTGVVNTMFYDPQYPLGIVNVMPVPSAADTLSFPAWVAASTLSTLSTSNTFAAGGIKALKTNVAVLLKAYFLDSQLSEELMMAAIESKEAIKYTNMTSRAMIRRHTISKQPRVTPL